MKKIFLLLFFLPVITGAMDFDDDLFNMNLDPEFFYSSEEKNFGKSEFLPEFNNKNAQPETQEQESTSPSTEPAKELGKASSTPSSPVTTLLSKQKRTSPRIKNKSSLPPTIPQPTNLKKNTAVAALKAKNKEEIHLKNSKIISYPLSKADWEKIKEHSYIFNCNVNGCTKEIKGKTKATFVPELNRHLEEHEITLDTKKYISENYPEELIGVCPLKDKNDPEKKRACPYKTNVEYNYIDPLRIIKLHIHKHHSIDPKSFLPEGLVQKISPELQTLESYRKNKSINLVSNSEKITSTTTTSTGNTTSAHNEMSQQLVFNHFAPQKNVIQKRNTNKSNSKESSSDENSESDWEQEKNSSNRFTTRRNPRRNQNINKKTESQLIITNPIERKKRNLNQKSPNPSKRQKTLNSGYQKTTTSLVNQPDKYQSSYSEHFTDEDAYNIPEQPIAISNEQQDLSSSSDDNSSNTDDSDNEDNSDDNSSDSDESDDENSNEQLIFENIAQQRIIIPQQTVALVTQNILNKTSNNNNAIKHKIKVTDPLKEIKERKYTFSYSLGYILREASIYKLEDTFLTKIFHMPKDEQDKEKEKFEYFKKSIIKDVQPKCAICGDKSFEKEYSPADIKHVLNKHYKDKHIEQVKSLNINFDSMLSDYIDNIPGVGAKPNQSVNVQAISSVHNVRKVINTNINQIIVPEQENNNATKKGLISNQLTTTPNTQPDETEDQKKARAVPADKSIVNRKYSAQCPVFIAPNQQCAFMIEGDSLTKFRRNSTDHGSYVHKTFIEEGKLIKHCIPDLFAKCPNCKKWDTHLYYAIGDIVTLLSTHTKKCYGASAGIITLRENPAKYLWRVPSQDFNTSQTTTTTTSSTINLPQNSLTNVQPALITPTTNTVFLTVNQPPVHQPTTNQDLSNPEILDLDISELSSEKLQQILQEMQSEQQ